MRQIAFGDIVDLDFAPGYANRFPPAQAIFEPAIVPSFVAAWHHKELDFHLFEFAHAEQKVAWVDFVAEGLADLGNPKRQFATGGRQHIAKVSKDALGCFGAQIGKRIAVGHGANGGFEHHVEGACFGQIA